MRKQSLYCTAWVGISELHKAVFLLSTTGLSPATSRSYKWGVHRYSSSCTSHGLIGFPLIEWVLCRFVPFFGPWRPVIQCNLAIPVCPPSWPTHRGWCGPIVYLVPSASLCPPVLPSFSTLKRAWQETSNGWSINIGLFVNYKMTTTLLACGLPAAQGLLASWAWRSSLAIPGQPTIRPFCHWAMWW